MIVPDIVHEHQVLLFLQESATAREAARLIESDKGVSAVMIVNRQGVLHEHLAERDLAVKVVAAGLDPDGVRLAAVMTAIPTRCGRPTPRAARSKEWARGGSGVVPVVEQDDGRRHGLGARPVPRPSARPKRTICSSTRSSTTGLPIAISPQLIGVQCPQRQGVDVLAHQSAERLVDEALSK